MNIPEKPVSKCASNFIQLMVSPSIVYPLIFLFCGSFKVAFLSKAKFRHFLLRYQISAKLKRKDNSNYIKLIFL